MRLVSEDKKHVEHLYANLYKYKLLSFVGFHVVYLAFHKVSV